MPTVIEDGYFVHTCRYCGHVQKEPIGKTTPFMFTQYRCTGCQRPLDDLVLSQPTPKKCHPA